MWVEKAMVARTSFESSSRYTEHHHKSVEGFCEVFFTNRAVGIFLCFFFTECLEATSAVQKLVTCTNNVGWKIKGHGSFHLTRSMLARTSFKSSLEVYNHHPTRLMVQLRD